MQVMLQLQNDAAMELHQQTGTLTESSGGESEAQELVNAAAELGVSLIPVHPGQTHPLLAPYFMVEVQNRETAEKVLDRLQRFNIVEAAYLKPEDQLP